MGNGFWVQGTWPPCLAWCAQAELWPPSPRQQRAVPSARRISRACSGRAAPILWLGAVTRAGPGAAAHPTMGAAVGSPWLLLPSPPLARPPSSLAIPNPKSEIPNPKSSLCWLPSKGHGLPGLLAPHHRESAELQLRYINHLNTPDTKPLFLPCLPPLNHSGGHPSAQRPERNGFAFLSLPKAFSSPAPGLAPHPTPSSPLLAGRSSGIPISLA